jgi:hypothetical protein
MTYTNYFIGQASKTLYGMSLKDAVEHMSIAWEHGNHEHGNTPIAVRKELRRTIQNIDKIGSVIIDLWDQL